MERYFLPEIKQAGLSYDYNVQKKLLKIGNGYVDLRSADRPENIEGFGYKNIFLNEAGIILKKNYLYTNAILPMMIDYKDSQLFAFGTPKGVLGKDGEEHKYFELWKKYESGNSNFNGRMLSSFDNPLNDDSDIDLLIEEIGKEGENVEQEIHGNFVTDSKGTVFKIFKHIKEKNIDYEYIFTYIDVATSGNDYLCQVIAGLYGSELHIIDVVMSKNDSNVTIPLCSGKLKEYKPTTTWIESNNAGGIFAQVIQSENYNRTIVPIWNSSNKETRIIAYEWFVSKYVRFRDDYESNSEYDLFMRQLKSFNKDKKLNTNDDAPDALTGLCRMIYGNYKYLYEE